MTGHTRALHEWCKWLNTEQVDWKYDDVPYYSWGKSRLLTFPFKNASYMKLYLSYWSWASGKGQRNQGGWEEIGITWISSWVVWLVPTLVSYPVCLFPETQMHTVATGLIEPWAVGHESAVKYAGDPNCPTSDGMEMFFSIGSNYHS